MIYWTDLYLRRDIDDMVIAAAVAAALGESTSAVAIVPYGTPKAKSAGTRPDVAILIQRQDLRRFGDASEWPYELAIGLRDGEPEDSLAALRTIAHELRRPILTDLPDDGQDMYRIVFPNGDALPRLLDDNDEPMLTEADRRQLAAYDRLPTIAG